VKRRVELPLAQAEAVLPGEFVRVVLPVPVWLPDGNLATSVIVGRARAEWVAYANVCRHQPVPLDMGGGSLVAPDGAHLLCHSHGALYRPSDGVCVAGPCQGEALFAARVVLHEGGVGIDL
jgi:nitrite reductase/ring-hydroxylating ferredoxin subunit